MASREEFIIKNPTGRPAGHSARWAVPAPMPIDKGDHNQDIFGGLALSALPHKATTSGRNHTDGDTNPFIGVDLSAAATTTKWSPPVRLPVVTP